MVLSANPIWGRAVGNHPLTTTRTFRELLVVRNHPLTIRDGYRASFSVTTTR